VGLRIDDPAFLIKPLRPKQPTPSRAKPRKALPRTREEPRRTDAGHVTGGQKLVPIVTDDDYYQNLHAEPCFITGLRGTAQNPIVAAHIGNPGKGMKNDCECLPLTKSIHDDTHRKGITVILDWLRDRPNLVIAILRSYARERYWMAKDATQASQVGAPPEAETLAAKSPNSEGDA
jgi:hypothetical protein